MLPGKWRSNGDAIGMFGANRWKTRRDRNIGRELGGDWRATGEMARIEKRREKARQGPLEAPSSSLPRLAFALDDSSARRLHELQVGEFSRTTQ